MLWWWLSVPYSIVFLVSIGIFEAFGVSIGAIGHSGAIVPFLLLAIATSLSSAIWFLVMSYYLCLASSIRLKSRASLLLSLSAVAGIWSVLYLWKG